MSYAQHSIIQAAHFNGFANDYPTNVNKIWSTGTIDFGYGQVAQPPVVVGELITASTQWNPLLNKIITSAAHQGTALNSYINSAPVTGDLIYYEPNFVSNLNEIETYRLNASNQGSTTSVPSTSGSSWVNSITFNFQITFPSGNASRHFFNSGGQLGLQFSHPAGSAFTINQLISDLCSDSGTVWVSSATVTNVTLAGIIYQGVTKVGGSNPGGTTIYPSLGIYAHNTSFQEIFRQTSDFYYSPYEPTYLRINCSYDISIGIVNLSILIDKIPDTSPIYAVVSAGTNSTLLIRYPSTIYLNDTWGVPSVSTSISIG